MKNYVLVGIMSIFHAPFPSKALHNPVDVLKYAPWIKQKIFNTPVKINA